MISLDFLEKVELFKELDDNQLTRVQSCCQETEFERDDEIFSAGEHPGYLWVVMEGQVQLIWNRPGRPASPENTITTLSPGMSFGWSSLVPPQKYRLSAYCATRKCTVMKIKKDSLIKLFESDAAIGYQVMSKLLSVIGTRFHQLQDEVAKRRGHDIINRW
jgi:CRP-like cAMP-binding protein